MKSTISEKGQVTIPKPLRERLGIQPGQVLDFQEENGRLIITKVIIQSPVDAVYGLIRLQGGTDAALDDLRGEADLR